MSRKKNIQSLLYALGRNLPVVTMAVASIMVVFIQLLPDLLMLREQGVAIEASSSYQTQLKQLNQVETNIQELLTFVEAQKIELKEVEETITALESEQQALEPIVQTNREVIEALFQVQEARNKSSVRRERSIGFVLGTIASLMASLLWTVGQRLWFGSQKKNSLPK